MMSNSGARMRLIFGGIRGLIIGAPVGGFIAFLLRPYGQLSFKDVLTRGANLEGPDKILVPLAQTSFNYMLAGIVLGAVMGLVGGMVISYLFRKTEQGQAAH